MKKKDNILTIYIMVNGIVKHHYSLSKFNTFGVDCRAELYVKVSSVDELVLFLKERDSILKEEINSSDKSTLSNMVVLGGGSNLLFPKQFKGAVLHPVIKGVEIVKESLGSVQIKVGSGEIMDEFIDTSISRGWYGAENLSNIPGVVGAAPVQNVGAYGVEASDIIKEVEVVSIDTGDVKVMTKEECGFGYRDSIFKMKQRGEFVVSAVTFELERVFVPKLQYRALKELLDSREVERSLGELKARDVREAIVEIRSSKLPDPKEIGSGGSFFKNPEVSLSIYNRLIERFPGMPSYPIDKDHVKLSAGWIIDRAGWRGVREGDVGVHKDQALVIVNYGNATGEEVITFSDRVKDDIYRVFNIELEREVIWLGE